MSRIFWKEGESLFKHLFLLFCFQTGLLLSFFFIVFIACNFYLVYSHFLKLLGIPQTLFYNLHCELDQLPYYIISKKQTFKASYFFFENSLALLFKHRYNSSFNCIISIHIIGNQEEHIESILNNSFKIEMMFFFEICRIHFQWVKFLVAKWFKTILTFINIEEFFIHFHNMTFQDINWQRSHNSFNNRIIFLNITHF